MDSSHPVRGSVGLGLGLATDWWIDSSNFAAGIHAIYCILAGFSSGLLCFITVILWRRPTRSLTTWIYYLGSTFSLVLLTSIFFACIVVRFTKVMAGAGEDSTTLSKLGTTWVEYNDLFPAHGSLGDITNVPLLPDSLQILFVLLSDGAIVYRAIILTGDSTTRKLLLALGWFVCLLFGILSFPLSTVSTPASFRWPPLLIGFLCASLACNLSATGTIAFIAWQHHKLLRVQLGFRHARTTLSQRILGTLLESGMVYCIFQVAILLLVFLITIGHPFHDYDAATPSQQVLGAMYMGLSATYPAFVFAGASIQAASSDEHMEWFIGSMAVSQ